MKQGIVLKKQADEFVVDIGKNQLIQTKARKNLKKDGVFVGDRVFLDDDNVICKIEKRKNLLIRPPLANLDKMFIVVAPIPKPDFYTIDKLLIFCKLNSIEPILCINKCDINKKECEEIQKIYKNIVKTHIFSTLDESVLKLKSKIRGVCALAGQSAVGKSSIINALRNEQIAKVDTFSKKIERGKQTTRVIELYNFGENKFLADTAGFSKLDERLLEIDEHEIKRYYPDFLKYAGGCKYSSCEHLLDKNCAVYDAVKAKKISSIRYENYLKLYENLRKIKKY